MTESVESRRWRYSVNDLFEFGARAVRAAASASPLSSRFPRPCAPNSPRADEFHVVYRLARRARPAGAGAVGLVAELLTLPPVFRQPAADRARAGLGDRGAALGEIGRSPIVVNETMPAATVEGLSLLAQRLNGPSSAAD